MHNLSNNSNTGYRNTTNTLSIEYMQKHITELTLYISQNNHKYNKNMQTLKEFYQQQLEVLQNDKQQLQHELAIHKNQVNLIQDLLANSDRKLAQAQQRLVISDDNLQQTREKLMTQRKKIDQIYQQMSAVRKTCMQELQKASSKATQLEQKNNKLNLQIHQKDTKIQSLTDKIYLLEDQLAERYSLPQKIQDVEKDYQNIKGALQVTKRKCQQLQQKLDYQDVQLQKYRKQNESLRIMKGKYSAEKNLEIQKAVKIQRENAANTIKKLQTLNQSLIYQINDCENRVKSLKAEINILQAELKKQKSNYQQLDREMHNTTANKDAYISEFAELKRDYEQVIRKLEQTLIEYQKKNWSMQQENKQLNDQLQALKELLNELKAINNFQPARQEYRKLAQLQVMARKSEPKPLSSRDEPRIDPPQSEMQGEWQRLMLQIQKIQA